MKNQIIVDIGSRKESLAIDCYYEGERGMECASYELPRYEEIALGDDRQAGSFAPPPKKAIHVLMDYYRVSPGSVFFTDGPHSCRDLTGYASIRHFLEEYGLMEEPFALGEEPDRPFGVPIKLCHSIRDRSKTRPKKAPETLSSYSGLW